MTTMRFVTDLKIMSPRTASRQELQVGCKGTQMLVTNVEYWWRNVYIDDIFMMLMPEANVQK